MRSYPEGMKEPFSRSVWILFEHPPVNWCTPEILKLIGKKKALSLLAQPLRLAMAIERYAGWNKIQCPLQRGYPEQKRKFSARSWSQCLLYLEEMSVFFSAWRNYRELNLMVRVWHWFFRCLKCGNFWAKTLHLDTLTHQTRFSTDIIAVEIINRKY